MKRVGTCKEEKKLSYYKYFERPLVEADQKKKDILAGGVSDKKALSFADKDLFLLGEDQDYCQDGYGVAGDGTGFVCNTTLIPKANSTMMDWWFAWHSVGSDLRYKIWDPEDHYFARADNVAYVCNPDVPMHEKTWNVNHYILEDIGMGPSFLKLCFKSPQEFGFTKNLADSKFADSLVCGIGESDVAAAMVHKWYETSEGLVLKSRFWIGFTWKGGKILKSLPAGECVPVFVTRNLYAHSIKEFANLASFLPNVYQENGPDVK